MCSIAVRWVSRQSEQSVGRRLQWPPPHPRRGKVIFVPLPVCRRDVHLVPGLRDLPPSAVRRCRDGEGTDGLRHRSSWDVYGVRCVAVVRVLRRTEGSRRRAQRQGWRRQGGDHNGTCDEDLRTAV